MLIQFSVKNYRTFKEKATISLVASNYDKTTRESDNIFEDNIFNLRILKSAVIYGANASGKSKFMEALMFMKHLVITSSKDSQKGDKINIEPFRLSTETEHLPSEFEVVFTFKNEMYRYGFEANNETIISEWLYHRPKTKEVELFYREFQDFETHARNFSKGNTVIKEGLVRDNALLISVAAQFNDAIATIEAKKVKAEKIAILDGVLYIKGNNKMYKSVSETYKDYNIMSALVLREFLYQL